MSFKLLRKERVLTAGTGHERVVLDFDACLAYSYQNPEIISAVFDKGRWIVIDRPYYSSGGWGSGSHGDKFGRYTHDNTVSLLRTLGAKGVRVNLGDLSDLGNLKRMIAQSNKVKALKKSAKKLGLDPGGLSDFEENGLKVTPEWDLKDNRGKGMDPFKMLDQYESALQVFLTGKGKAVDLGFYTIKPHEVRMGKRLVAFRDAAGQVFMNSELLQVSTFEKNFLGGESVIQKSIREISKFNIPFNVLESADLKLNETKILEAGPAETFTIQGQERHFTGALLLENHGRKFLMDVDRREIDHGIFNAFFVEVKKHAKTIAEAYDSMKPDEVKAAEAAGIEVLRQGEWFFIATDKTVSVPKSQVMRWGPATGDDAPEKQVARFDVSHGKGRPNSLARPVGFGTELDSLVCGDVTHSGREHARLCLGIKDTKGKELDYNSLSYGEKYDVTFKLWKLVPNTTVSNFTITGDID